MLVYYSPSWLIQNFFFLYESKLQTARWLIMNPHLKASYLLLVPNMFMINTYYWKCIVRCQFNSSNIWQLLRVNTEYVASASPVPSIILEDEAIAMNKIYTFSPLQEVIVWWVFQESTCKDAIRSPRDWRKYLGRIMEKGVGVDEERPWCCQIMMLVWQCCWKRGRKWGRERKNLHLRCSSGESLSQADGEPWVKRGVTSVTWSRNGPAQIPLLCLVIGSEQHWLGVNATV